MKELINSFLGIMCVAAVCFFIGCRYGRKTAGNGPEPPVIERVDTIIQIDTIVREKPIYRYSYVYDTVRTYFTTVRHDTVLVDVPIERKVYQEDSLYRCIISGWRPNLDTLIVWPTTTTITIHEKVKVPKKFAFGIAAGPSFLVTPKGNVYGGIGATAGIQYRF